MCPASPASDQPAVVERDLIVTDRLTRVAAGASIVDEVTFAVPRSSLFAINGPSGSGKSTLLNLLTGLDRPTSGRITFAGKALVGDSENALARWRGRHVGIVFQSFHLIPTLTAFENVLLALELGGVAAKRDARARASQCLASVGVGSLGRRLPRELSGGEQQRVAIARALANDPPLIVADEPTGNLDSGNAESVFALLEALVERGKTVVYVTHDRQLAARAHASIDLLDGQIVARRALPAEKQQRG
jgi:ABC-type lipoprotein export system ATPase subunit